MLRCNVRGALGLLATGALACTGSAESTGVGGTGGAGWGGGGTGGTDGGGACSTGGAHPQGYASVVGASGQYGPSMLSTVFASFLPYSEAVTGCCSVASEGSCTIEECTFGGGGSGGSSGSGGAPSSPSAGTIHVTGGVRDVVLVPDATGQYPTDSSTTSPLYTEGQSIIFAADGAQVAGFSEQLTAPSLITVTAPGFGGGSVTVPTSTDLSIAWAGGNYGDVVVILLGWTADNDTTVRVFCTYSATAGAATVTSSALSHLRGLPNGSLVISGRSMVLLQPSGWDLTLALNSVAVSTTGLHGMASAQATFP
jgi:hypothetical protein